MSIKERALARRNFLNLEEVEMPEWADGDGVSLVFVRELSAIERDAHEAGQLALNKSGKALENFRARLVAATACDQEGNRLFADENIPALGELPCGEIRRLFDAAARLNGLTAAEEKKIEKHSELPVDAARV